jgi:hypothetical protein
VPVSPGSFFRWPFQGCRAWRGILALEVGQGVLPCDAIRNLRLDLRARRFRVAVWVGQPD